MNAQRLFATMALIAVASTLAACSDEAVTEEAADQIQPADLIPILDWADLMPEGEEERLGALYDKYYRDLERQMMSSQMQLSQAAQSVGDIEEGSALDAMPQLGTFNTVAALDGKRVRLPGFVVPLDYYEKDRLRNFLFVPYYGACIHTPPPPPNQIVFIEGEASISLDDIWMPFWADGTLHADKAESELGDAAYTMTLNELVPYKE